MPDAITLYDAPGSPCARRVRAVLLEKGLTWTTRLVDLTRLEQKEIDILFKRMDTDMATHNIDLTPGETAYAASPGRPQLTACK